MESDSEVQVLGRNLGEVPGGHFRALAVSTDGSRLLAATDFEGVLMLTFDSLGSHRRHELPGFGPDACAVAVSPDNRLAAGASLGWTDPADRVVRVWSLKSLEEVMVLGRDELNRGTNLAFTSAGRLLSATEAGLTRWDLDTGEGELVYEGTVNRFAGNRDGDRVLLVDNPSVESPSTPGSAVLVNLENGAVNQLDAHGDSVWSVALDDAGELVVTGSEDGIIRVGKANSGEPHLLLGHEGRVRHLAVDPKGRWIASGGQDGTVRFWPMPDLDALPLHTLPHDELIARLENLTNLRAVRDEEAASGWKIDIGPFPGWETVPIW